MRSYIFLLSPPYCGSTLLYKLLSTSESVSCLPNEGQFIDEVKDIMRDSCWDSEKHMPWPYIKTVWHRYWDESKFYLVEKSPPNLVRSKLIEENFNQPLFIISVRNPYAHCEGLIRRRNGWDEKKAVEFCIFCLKEQMKNSQILKNTIVTTYEDFCDHPLDFFEDLSQIIPD